MIRIPENLKGKELFKYLVEHKHALIAQKKSMLKRTEPVFCNADFITPAPAEGSVKSEDGNIPVAVDSGVLRVKVVANTSMWCDSHMDVLLPDSAKRSIKERKGMIPHIHDHIWEVTAELGDVQNIYYQDIPLKQLGINKPGTAQALIFETDIRKDYNERVFLKYKAGKIKQHSIGLTYVKIELAINDPDYEKEIDFWNKYINEIINKEVAEEKGYFWVVSEYKLMENSAVLFGSNILTPTLDAQEQSGKSTDDQPPAGTDIQPLKQEVVTEIKSSVDWDKITKHLFN